MEINEITKQIIGAAYKVHRALGPGLLEKPYQVCLAHELRSKGLVIDIELGLPIHYEEVVIDIGYRIDLLIEDQVVVELKSVKNIIPLHQAQLLSYLKLSKKRIGLIINFNVIDLKQGILRLAN